MNRFEKRIKTLKVIAFVGCALLLCCAISAVIVGLKVDMDANPDTAWIALPIVLGFAGIMMTALGFSLSFSYRVLYRTAKTLFTEAELCAIERPMFLQAHIAEKAKRLMEEGKRKNDMTEFNEFCQIAAISRPGFFGNYGMYR